MTTKTKISLAASIGVIVGLAVSYVIYLANQPKPFEPSGFIKKGGAHPKLGGTIPFEDGAPNLKAYRKVGSLAKLSLTPNSKINGLLHDTTSVKNYYTDIFFRFKQSHMKNLPAGFHWEIGLYPNICIDPKSNSLKINVYIIPTLASDGDNEKIKDYFTLPRESNNTDPYTQYYDGSKLWNKDEDEYIFDQGTLFP